MAMQPRETENLKRGHDALTGTARSSAARSAEPPAVPVKSGQLLTSVRGFCLVVLLIASSSWPTAAQTPQTSTQPETVAPAIQAIGLSPEATQVAEEIGVAPLLNQLSSKPAAGSPMNLESLVVRQEITERVLSASLDIDSVNAVI